jgi:TetR/AcrR family transcriptional regulator, cholesterol catabolism regulator
VEASVKERRYNQRKREIIDAAARVFAQKGYHGASTKDIARVLGIQQGSLYHYITSKEEALEEVCWQGIGQFLSGAQEILASKQSAPKNIEAAVANHLLPMKDRADYVVVFITERQHLPDAMRRRVGKSARLYETVIEDLYARGIADGAFRADLDVRLAARAMLGLCNSATLWLARPSDYSIDEVVQGFASILLSGVKS